MSTTPTTSNMTGLDSDFIKSLMGKSRNRNAYGPRLLEFMESDEAGINPADVWPEFAEKQATTLYQGFMLAAKRAEVQDQLLIKQYDDKCFILHKERVAIMQASQ